MTLSQAVRVHGMAGFKTARLSQVLQKHKGSEWCLFSLHSEGRFVNSVAKCGNQRTISCNILHWSYSVTTKRLIKFARFVFTSFWSYHCESGHVNGTCSLIFLLFVGLHCLPNAKKVLSDGSSGSDHIIHNQPWPREQPPTLMKAHYMHFDSSDRFLPWHSENLSHDFLLSSWAVPCSHWRKFPI